VDLRGATPVLLVADRTNNRIQRFGLDGKHIDIVEGTNLPCHFHERQGTVVVPDLANRITLLNRENNVILHLGDAKYTNEERRDIRISEDRSVFPAGKFVSPHSAIFDHSGNIFVVEYVEIGRVTKLRKV
jgi:hypothetical protein